MRTVLGVDPGSKGGFALYDADTHDLVWAVPMPTIKLLVGRTKKPRVDPVAIHEIVQAAIAYGCKLMVIEAVGGRPKQSAMHAFTFGHGTGMIYMAAVVHRLSIEAVPAALWKRMMKVPATVTLPSGRKKKDVEGIAARTAEVFPRHMERFKTKRGAWLDGPMEAAHLAKMGADRLLHLPASYDEWRESLLRMVPVAED